MPVRSRRTGWVYTTALSWWVIPQRISFVLLLGLSLGILIFGYSKPVVVQSLRSHVIDGVAPVLDVVSKPLAAIDELHLRIQSYRDLLKENAQLKARNAELTRWQMTAATLKNENTELRSLLHYKNEPAASYISARTIADTGGAFVHTLVVTAGRLDGVREGMAAMTGDGLIGRVVEVGEWTSRLLLITDANSRVPVIVMGTGEHAVLAGNNTAKSDLLYLPQEADIKPGQRVVTSGHGGLLPPNVPVGVVVEAGRSTVEVAPISAMNRINQVLLVDFNLEAGAFNPMTAKVQRARP